jgi:hypothetical protein
MPLMLSAGRADEPAVEILDCSSSELSASTSARTVAENSSEHSATGSPAGCGETSTAAPAQALESGTCHFVEDNACSAQSTAAVSGKASAAIASNGVGTFSISAHGSAGASISGSGEELNAYGSGLTDVLVRFQVNTTSTFQISGDISSTIQNSEEASTEGNIVLERLGEEFTQLFTLSSGSGGLSGTLGPGTYVLSSNANLDSHAFFNSGDPSTSSSHAEFDIQGNLTVTPGATASCTSEGQPAVQVGLALAEGCFIERKDGEGHGTGVFETSEEAWVGGFDLRPNPGGMLVIEPSNHEAPLRAEGSGVNLLLRHLSVPAPLGEIRPFVNSYSLGINMAGSLERFLALPLISGQMTVEWNADGAGATLEGSISLEELSKSLGSLEEAGVGTTAGKLTLKLHNNAPADVSGGELQLPEFTVGVKGTDPELKMGFGGAVLKAQEVSGTVEWSGELSVLLPFQKTNQGSITARLFLRDSSLSGVGFAVSGFRAPLGGGGWFLSGVNGNVVLSPEFGLDVGIEAVRELSKKGNSPTLFKLTGNVKALKLASDCKNGSNPFEFIGTTNAPELEARKIGELKAQILMCAYVPDAKDFAFEAGVKGELSVDVGNAKKVVSASGSASGWFHGYDFNLDGNYNLKLPVFGVFAATGLLSSEGYAICGQYGFISAGVATHNWLEAPEDIVGCDFSAYRAAAPAGASASAAHATHKVRLRSGESVVSLAVRGANGAPRLRVSGPHGERFTSPSGAKPLKGKMAIIVPEAALHTTYVYLRRPASGIWSVQSLGGAPLKRIDIAHQLPKPKVSATITGKGAEEILRWKARPIPGQQIALIDRTDGVATTLQDFTSRHSGKLRFTPEYPSDAPRTIEADVLQNGIPRARLTVGRYSASGSGKRAPRIAISRASCSGRTCRAKISLPADTSRVRVELRHGKRTIAATSDRAKPGPRGITLRLHHLLGAGTYTLRVTATLTGGRTASTSKSVHIRQARTGQHP